MTHSFFFGLQILIVVFVRNDFYRNVFNDFESIGFKPDSLCRIVCKQSHLLHSELSEYLCTAAIVSLVRLKAEMNVCFHCIKSLFL